MCINKLLKRKDMADILNINSMTLFLLVKKDKNFPFVRIGNRMFFDKKKVLQYLSNNYVIEDINNITHLINIKESAKIFRISDQAMRKLAREDSRLQYFKIGSLYRFSKDSLFKYLEIVSRDK